MIINSNIKKNIVDANSLIYRLICKAANYGITNIELNVLKSNVELMGIFA
jgi:hypothetical protein